MNGCVRWFVRELRAAWARGVRVDDTEGERIADEWLKAEGARLLAQVEAQSVVKESSRYGPRALFGPLTSVVQKPAAEPPGGGEVSRNERPAAGHLDLPSADDLRMAALGLAGRTAGDWRALGDRLRNLADFWDRALTNT